MSSIFATAASVGSRSLTSPANEIRDTIIQDRTRNSIATSSLTITDAVQISEEAQATIEELREASEETSALADQLRAEAEAGREEDRALRRQQIELRIQQLEQRLRFASPEDAEALAIELRDLVSDLRSLTEGAVNAPRTTAPTGGVSATEATSSEGDQAVANTQTTTTLEAQVTADSTSSDRGNDETFEVTFTERQQELGRDQARREELEELNRLGLQLQLLASRIENLIEESEDDGEENDAAREALSEASEGLEEIRSIIANPDALTVDSAISVSSSAPIATAATAPQVAVQVQTYINVQALVSGI